MNVLLLVPHSLILSKPSHINKCTTMGPVVSDLSLEALLYSCIHHSSSLVHQESCLFFL